LQAGAEQKLKNEDCLACHSDASLTKDVNGKAVSLAVDGDKFKHSIHGTMFSCVDCHSDVKSLAHDTPPKKVTCTQCHAEAHDAYLLSTHAKASKTGKSPAANCEDCHGGVHEILPSADAKSPVNHANIPYTCGRCHGQKFLMEQNGVSAQPFVSYQESVHGRAVEKGSDKAAVCTDCHGSHSIVAGSDPKSPISKFAVPATCSKCHADVANTFSHSIHGQALARGNQMSPNCTDCHGIHSIKSHKDPNSPVAEQNLSEDTCARCHEGVRLSQEFGVPANRVQSYQDTYHGLAAKGGSVVAANCSSCHGVHNILPSTDPHSTVNKANLEATCGKCHQGVTQKFIQTKVHQEGGLAGDLGTRITGWVRVIYIALILLVIGAMFLHNAIIWRYKAVAARRMQNPMMTRMTTHQRWQHLVLLVSFIVLVITGFALKFPYTWFAENFGMGEHWRGIIHRIAGVVLMGAGIYHLFYLAMLAEGRKLIRDLAPRPKDVTDVWGTMLYYLGLRKTKPQFGRFNYAEKAEYWALVWGTALMGLTGVMLWAKVWVGNTLARWWVDVATAVHFYEAILATLAIVVWHFYQVFLDPDVYPMNWAWWDGKMPVEHYKHEHGLDTEAIAEAEAKDTKPPAK
jgi:cytochrome b subunit of formate dehydrogenase/nitrate/TMAO reductase-like tetraheme cytochrome c subunit